MKQPRQHEAENDAVIIHTKRSMHKSENKNEGRSNEKMK